MERNSGTPESCRLPWNTNRNFNKAIEKAKTVCKGSENSVSDHFVDINKIVNIGSCAVRELTDIELSRYACYLIVQNANPRKEIIAVGQTYFAIKTRQQELIENYDNLDEDLKRLAIRNEMKKHNKFLTKAAKMARVPQPRDYIFFQNKGYQKEWHFPSLMSGCKTIIDQKKRGKLCLMINFF